MSAASALNLASSVVNKGAAGLTHTRARQLQRVAAGHASSTTISKRRHLRAGPVRVAAMVPACAPFVFTPVESGVGGLTLGLLTFAKLRITGRVLGISGTVRGLLGAEPESWRMAFVLGLLAGGLALKGLLPTAFEMFPEAYTPLRAAVAGLLVGLGTSRGSGCTSGHGICGNARLSPRSFVATLTFMVAGALASHLAGTAALFGLPHGVAPLAGAPLAATPATTLGAALLAATLVITLLLTAVGKQLTSPSRAPSAADLSTELNQAASLETTPLTTAPPPAEADAQKLAALSVGSDLLFGFLFALGLGVSGMVKPSKVAGFLSVLSGVFDPSLMFVMGGALLVALPTFQWALRRSEPPLCAPRFYMPNKKVVDPDLVLGALVFGAGWGIGGICPGPGLVALATLQPKALIFIGAMLAGMRLDQAMDAVAAMTNGNGNGKQAS